MQAAAIDVPHSPVILKVTELLGYGLVGLKGRLSSLPLVDVLKLIDAKGHTGRLLLEDGQRRSILYLEQGQLMFLSCLMDPVHMGLRLAWMGDLPRREYLAWKLAVKQGQKSTTIDFYPGEGVSPEAWQRAFEVALQDEALEIFQWPDGDFEFETGSLSLPPGLQLNRPIETFLQQGIHQAEEWKKLQTQLPGEDVVPAITDFSLPESLVPDAPPTESEWQMLAHVDGRRDLRALAAVSVRSYFHTCESVLALSRKGFVRWTPRPSGNGRTEDAAGRSGEAGRSLLQLLTSKDKGVNAPSVSPISVLAEFENRLLERLEEEAEGGFDARQFLQRQWPSLWTRHPLMDGFPWPGNRVGAFRFEDEVARWEDAEACEEVVLDCLCALQELVEATYQQMEEGLGDKKALQGYRKDYEQVLGGGLPSDVVQELSWLSLAR